MTGVVTLRGVRIGEGRTKVAASLTSSDAVDLRAEALRLAAAPVDVAEWRVDHFHAVDDVDAVLAALTDLRGRLGEVPLLVTVRGVAEGGAGELTDAGYVTLLEAVVGSGHADAIDLELSRPRAALETLIGTARAAGVAVVASSHDFAGTPAAEEIVARLTRMSELGADVLKVAVTPRGARDVLTLLDATLTASDRLPRPVVTMAMGADGVVSRLAGEVFGSALTFGALQRASAPGQIDVVLLAPVVDAVHRHLASDDDGAPGRAPAGR